MIKLVLSFLLIGGLSVVKGQTPKKYAIGNSGCSVYTFCDPGVFEENYSEDSAKVFTSECGFEGAYYGVICIRLKDELPEMSAAEDVLVTYLDFLKSAFKISSATGYGKGLRLKGNEKTRGIVDYWKDDEKNNWKVKGWTNGKFIAVLYAYSLKELSETRVNAVLDGFLFKGM